MRLTLITSEVNLIVCVVEGDSITLAIALPFNTLTM